MTDLTSMTIAEARKGLASKSFTALELTDAHLAAIEAARSLNAFVLETPDRRVPWPARSMPKSPRARAARWPAFRSGSRTCSRPRTCAPPRAQRSSAISCRLTNPPSPRSSGATARSCSASSTMTNSRWGRRTRPRASAPSSTRGGARAPTPRWCRAAHPADRRPRWPRCSAWARPRPTPAARSASRRPSPRPSASSPPTAAVRAGASWRLPRRSTRPARSRAPTAMPRS